MKIKRYLSLWVAFLLFIFPVYLLADTENEPADPSVELSQDDLGSDLNQDLAPPAEEPAFANAAQAMHAANLAEAAAMQPNEATKEAAEDLSSTRETYNEAYRNALADPDDPIITETLTQAEQDLEAAREAYAEQVGALAGVMGSEIQAMRQDRMGWGQIAHELGVHPGTLGLGHGKRTTALDPVDPVDAALDDPSRPAAPDTEIAEATVRNPKTGWSSGHGLATAKGGSSKKGLGLSNTSTSTAGNNPGKGVGNDKGAQSKSSNSKSSGTKSQSNNSAAQSNSNRGNDGGPSGNNKGGNSGNKNSDKGSKSNNGKGNKK